jgi:hypothetical protein
MSIPETKSYQPRAVSAANEVLHIQKPLLNDIDKESMKRLHIQSKLSIGSPEDSLEHEADAVAEKVMRMPENIIIQRKCAECEDEEKLQRKPLASFIQKMGYDSGTTASDSVTQQIDSTKGSGSVLESTAKSFMENRFGTDFSGVKIHSGDYAAKMSQELNAQAFTVGNDIYFNSGKYNPNSDSGKYLLAHELTHTVQQGEGIKPILIQRDGMGDLRLSEDSDNLIIAIKNTAAYKALAPGTVTLTQEIIDEVNKKTVQERHYYLVKLKALFDTPEKSAAVITTETNQSTATAVTVEKARVAKPVQAANTSLEENASKDPSRSWTGIKGKFGGGTYYVDARSASNIVVKAKIFLKPTGTGTPANVNDIKAMEDGIEKVASTKGYLVDIQFVNDASDPDTFTVEVDPSRWEVATNWSGGDPTGFAHELHHMFAFELDRYNYIEAHAENQSMNIPDRLYWFRQELKKPAGYNDPTSIMDSASHPNDDDVCTVAGVNKAACLADRKKMAKP